jgi:hypothetical protein
MTGIPSSFSRTVPFLKILHKSKPRVNKIELLKKFPDFVINDIIELLYNILIGNVNIKPNQKKALAKHKKTVYKFASLPSLKSRRNFIYKQKGGFLTAILPIIASLIGGLVS